MLVYQRESGTYRDIHPVVNGVGECRVADVLATDQYQSHIFTFGIFVAKLVRCRKSSARTKVNITPTQATVHGPRAVPLIREGLGKGGLQRLPSHPMTPGA